MLCTPPSRRVPGLRHRAHRHASPQRSARRRSVKRTTSTVHAHLNRWGTDTSSQHKSLHDTTEWEAEGKDTTQTRVGAGPVLCSGTLRPDSVLGCAQSSPHTATAGCRYITLSTEPRARRTADARWEAAGRADCHQRVTCGLGTCAMPALSFRNCVVFPLKISI